ncbi:prenyltransferase/squalene oxidase repeat-containing protein [Streptomyces sp. B3I8]|uniref:prenyltransferase/squalene oxidase repeat-containing protein n=1 Tax=Streptomyces sp. B3I8 TaxID=3042303 RepID=UPI002782C2C2|nr:prenyltransferase/squalene oxidase repeat-containing protein [Streptomyces sp. B3I8]MDQ0791475.1 squalene-hopene/tetraprenyl-beta-curcumene cyclase [Streptomyces sp. B3I8]
MTTPLLVDEVSDAIDAAAGTLFAAQRPDGVFDYGAPASTLGTVGAVGALHFGDPEGSADLIARGATWLARTQGEDGGWSMVPGQVSEAGPTALATAVLHLVAPRTAADRVRAGREWTRRHGGLEAIPNPEVVDWCRQFFAYAGWLDPRDMPRFPIEPALLPALYRRLFDLRMPTVSASALAEARHRPPTGFRRLPARWAGPRALSVVRQVYEHGGATGSWYEDPWVTGLIVTGLARAEVGRDMVEGAVRWLRAQENTDEQGVVEGSWSTGPPDLTSSVYATRGLLAAGYGDEPRLKPVKALLLKLQRHEPFAAFGSPPGFWGRPGTLGTGEAVSVLARLPGTDQADAVRRGVTWLTLQQDSRGSWGSCVRNTRVADSGPCPHLTAKALDALLDSGVPADDRRVRRGLRWLAKAQRPEGSYESVWFRMHTAGTSAVLQTFARVGLADAPAAVRARRWLERTRRDDGSWSTGDPADAGTVEETSWALAGLLAAGAHPRELLPGVRWLLAARLPDGGWPAAPVNEYVRHVSRCRMPALTQGLALRALAHYRQESTR